MSVQQILKLITDWGKEFQSLITLTEKKNDLNHKQFVCGLNNFMLCPLVVIVENDKKVLCVYGIETVDHF